MTRLRQLLGRLVCAIGIHRVDGPVWFDKYRWTVFMVCPRCGEELLP